MGLFQVDDRRELDPVEEAGEFVKLARSFANLSDHVRQSIDDVLNDPGRRSEDYNVNALRKGAAWLDENGMADAAEELDNLIDRIRKSELSFV